MKKTILRLLKKLASQKSSLIIILVAAIFSSICYAFIPIFSGKAIDNLIAAIKIFDGTQDTTSFLLNSILEPVLFLLGAAILSTLLAYIQQYVVASVGEKLTLSLRKEINTKITKLPIKYFDSNKTGDILTRVTNDLEKVSEVMQTGLMQFIYSILTIIITIIAMLFLNPILTLVVLITVSIASILTMIISKKSQYLFGKNQEVIGELNTKIEEIYTGNSIIKIFNHQKETLDSILKVNNKQYTAVKKAEFLNYAIYPIIRFLNQLGFIATAIVGSIFALQGVITIGTVQAFLQYVNQISEPITQSSYTINSLQAALVSLDRVFNLLDAEEEIDNTELLSTSSIKRGEIRFENVQFGYNPDKMLIKNMNLTVNPNETIAIVGPTGGGKTTIINLLMRFYEINKGKITIDGINISDISRNKLRSMIGMVLQDTWLFEGTIAENIAYGNPSASMKEIISAAKSARCHKFIEALPNGYKTILSSESSSISEGQIQLITIARAMLLNPIIMILDEATSSVDTRTEIEIQKAMYSVMKGKTSFVIAHRLSTIKNADLIIVVKDGDIIETGNHSSLLKKNGFYSSLYKSQYDFIM